MDQDGSVTGRVSLSVSMELRIDLRLDRVTDDDSRLNKQNKTVFQGTYAQSMEYPVQPTKINGCR